VKTRNKDDQEWWELFDDNHKLPYYYNTKSGETEWLKPVTGTVIPLISIQNSSIGKRVSVAIKRASTMNTFGDFAAGPKSVEKPAEKSLLQQKKSFASVVAAGSKSSSANQPLTEDELRYMYNNTAADGSISFSPVQPNVRQQQHFEQSSQVQQASQMQPQSSQVQQSAKKTPTSSIQNISNPTPNQEAAMKMSPLNPANAAPVARKDPGFVTI
jgi:hypothetical protein